MKKLIIYIAAALIVVGCGSKSNTQPNIQEYISQIRNGLASNGIDTTDISSIYSEEKECLEMSYKGKMMTVAYEIHFKDLLSDTPTSFASNFLISMVVPRLQKESTISHMELIIGNSKYVVIPFHVETIGDDFITLGFSSVEESFRVCMELLASSKSVIVEARLLSDKGYIKIPAQDVFNLRSMALSYQLDGGKFE